MTITVEEGARAARLDEATAIADLADLGRAELLPTRGGDMWARRDSPEHTPQSIATAIDTTSQLVLAGTVDDTPVGYAVVTVEPMNDGTTVGVVTDIYVHPDARGIGIGERLLDLIIEWATTQGCAALDSVALPGNRETKNFFETFGMKARSLTVSRPL